MPELRADSLSYKAGGNLILSGVSLVFRPGQLAAVIGPSGSGKSTLIKCLTTTVKPTRGTVTVDGRDVWSVKAKFRQELGYVPQDDVIHPQLTVREAFYFASRLRLDEDFSSGAVDKRIEGVTALLGLTEARKRRIFRLSGGQRKRVNIGIELLADPAVLILDEPASGLDPGTEEDLVRLLSRLAKSGRTVVCTTHSMEYLTSFDRIVVMDHGQVAFCGDHPQLLAHFKVAHAADVFKALRGRPV